VRTVECLREAEINDEISAIEIHLRGTSPAPYAPKYGEVKRQWTVVGTCFVSLSLRVRPWHRLGGSARAGNKDRAILTTGQPEMRMADRFEGPCATLIPSSGPSRKRLGKAAAASHTQIGRYEMNAQGGTKAGCSRSRPLDQ